MSVSDTGSAVAVPARYRRLPVDAPADEIERELLERWANDGLFARAQAAAEGRPRYVFFEGPPTANGRPGIHHVFSRTIKDLFCRHRAMRGFFVARKAGWDTHGLPVEIEVEKQLGISGKQQIEEIGVEKFNQLCRDSVWRYRADWEKLSERIAFWLDYSDPYVTYSNDYVESVWWALKTLYERDLLYRGHKILPYCARCETALSSHEVAQGYKDVKDPSVYIALHLAGEESAGTSSRRILVWTTTPWTLVSNVALAVNPDLEYVELRKRNDDESETIILAASRAAAVLGDDYTDRWETVRIIRGSELAGLSYRRPLDWVELDNGLHQIIVAESFVSAEDGTGVVHMAPAFGADDYAAGKRNGLAFVQPVNGRGEFPADMPVVGGMFVKKADALIIPELKRRGVLWRAATIEHSYPHCWRCDTPLLYYARTSWFIRTTAYKDAMLARNARVDWHPPEMGEGRFGEWLTNNIDWAISRDRYWGTPLPLWICDRDDSHVAAIGSYAELAERSGANVGEGFDPHKPYIDAHSWDCACGGTMRRAPEVIDTWFDSGSMPFAQWHFPFENADKLKRNYPADFIAEGVDQTRGWFYSLLAIATGLGDALPRNTLSHMAQTGDAVVTAPYGAVVVNDQVLDAEGAKMSKSRGNVVDPWTVLAAYGADAVRLFFVASSQVWVPRRFDEAAIRDTAGRFLLTFKNVYSGIFALYANFGWEPSDADPAPAERPAIDRWILSRLASVERQADQSLEAYDATMAARGVMSFFVDDVSNWYVRLNRSRFYEVEGEDNRAAFATLREVLVVTCRLLAPFAPFVSDWVHTEVAGDSVHLASYVRDGEAERDLHLEEAMGHIRALSTLGRAAREEAGVKVRQPLSRMVCVVPTTAAAGAVGKEMTALIPLLAGELNVKQVSFLSSADDLVQLEAKANFRSLGKKFGKETPLAASAVAALTSEALMAFERGEPLAISVGNESRELDRDDLTIVRRASGELIVKEAAGYFAAIDPAVTLELRMEGLAREVVSRIQRMRKESGLAVSDRITVAITGTEELEAAVRLHQQRIAEEVLARGITVGDDARKFNAAQSVDIDGHPAGIALERAV
ncbi:MAG: isoleucine--tRNA ligase [Gemmatimonadales bacterium]